MLAGAENLVTLFIGIELLSIPLYVLCASAVRRRQSLESGLKYLIVGSVGSATLLYGLALIYGATGATDFDGIRRRSATSVDARRSAAADRHRPRRHGARLQGLGRAVPPVDARRLPGRTDSDHRVHGRRDQGGGVRGLPAASSLRRWPLAQSDWAPALAVLAAVTIVVGNAGAIAQRSLKRMLAWSGVAQAGYMLAGVVVGTKLGLQATVFYLAIYMLMNIAAFAVVIARERVLRAGDDIEALRDLGRASPALAWPMTIAMLALAGFPPTAGFIGKFYLIDAAVVGDYAWLGIVIVIGSMMSLVYYLRVIAVMWMGTIDVELPTAPPRHARPRAAGRRRPTRRRSPRCCSSQSWLRRRRSSSASYRRRSSTSRATSGRRSARCCDDGAPIRPQGGGSAPRHLLSSRARRAWAAWSSRRTITCLPTTSAQVKRNTS